MFNFVRSLNLMSIDTIWLWYDQNNQQMNNFKEKADLIWRVADLLRGDYKQSDYGKVILPMTVIRRLDCILESTKQKVELLT